MKTFKIIVLILALSLQVFSQESKIAEISKKIEIDGFYVWTMTGQNLSFMGTKYFGKHGFSLGVKYHINKIISDNESYAFKHRFYEKEFPESFGLNLGYKYEPIKGNNIVRPYIYYLLQASYLRLIQNFTFDPTSNNEAGFVILKETSPFYVLEHSIGIGLETRLYKNLYLNQSVGIGIANFSNHSETYYGEFPTEWVNSFRLGLSYRIK